MLADLFRFEKVKPILWLVNDKVEQENVARSCEEWFKGYAEVFKLDPKEENEHEAKLHFLHVLTALREQSNKIIIAPYTLTMREVPAPDQLEKRIAKLKVGETIPPVELFEKLIAEGYEVSDDEYLERGTYRGHGDVLNIFPVNAEHPVRIEFEFDSIAYIFEYSQDTGDVLTHLKSLSVYPISIDFKGQNFFEYIPASAVTIDDELEVTDEYYEAWEELFAKRPKNSRLITFTSFPEDSPSHINLRYLSVLKYQDLLDLAHDLKEKSLQDWRAVFFT